MYENGKTIDLNFGIKNNRKKTSLKFGSRIRDQNIVSFTKVLKIQYYTIKAIKKNDLFVSGGIFSRKKITDYKNNQTIYQKTLALINYVLCFIVHMKK